MIPDKYARYRPEVNFIKKYMDEKCAAESSDYDPNSNVSSKNLATLAAESGKRGRIYTSRLMMHDKLTEMYGEEEADSYIQNLETHRVYCHDETGQNPQIYCASITMYPFLRHGLKGLGGTSDAPKTLQSFAGGFVNLVFAASAQVLGAIATPEFLPYLNYFLVKEYGEDYYLKPDAQAELYGRRRTIDNVITDTFAQVVYSINQPAAARGNQAVFWNVSYFDEPYFKGLFEGFAFPDGTAMTDLWEPLWWLQVRFMKWFNHERTRKLLTFPVETFSLLNDGETAVDQRALKHIAQMYAEGHSFFTYTSDSVDSLSSCCFAPDTKILARSSNGVHHTTIKELHDMKQEDKENLAVFHNGSWTAAKTISLPARQMYAITTANKKTVVATDNHLFPTLRGDLRSDELTADDYIMFSALPLDSFSEHDEELSYEQGYLIGMYLGDGSIWEQNGYHETHLSLNEEKYTAGIPVIDRALKQFGVDGEFTLGKTCNHVYPLRLYGKPLADTIRQFVHGRYANEQSLDPSVFLQSAAFRRGIAAGLCATDSGNSNRIYTMSAALAEDMETLFATLGIQTILDTIDRTDEDAVIRGDYPLHCIRWYSADNNREMKDIYRIVNNSIYFRVKSVKKAAADYDTVYCFETKNQDEPYFTLPNGMITHNCRLKNNITANQFTYTLGAGGIATGSKRVMTININRLVQECGGGLPEIYHTLDHLTQHVHRYLKAYNALVLDAQARHMIPLYDAGFVSPEKQYLTVGVNGLVEAAEFLGIAIGDNPSYRKFVDLVLNTIHIRNVEDAEPGVMFNTEYVPAESLGVKNAKWDKADGLSVPRDCYNSYFFAVEDPQTSVLDKIRLHGKRYIQNLDGGSACHINLEEHLTETQYELLIRTAIGEGCSYFTFNVPNTICNDCGHISKHQLAKCPACGSDNLDYATRIIGYLTRVSKWSAERKEEYARRYFGGQEYKNEAES